MTAITPDMLRGLAALFSVLGSAILAWRVKRILDALSRIARMHEKNVRDISGGQIFNYILTNNTEHDLQRSQGTWLLVIGFIFLGLSGVLNFLAI